MNAPLSYEELYGQFVVMPACAFQDLWQAMNILEDRLQDDECLECVDYAKDSELGEVHHKIMHAAFAAKNILKQNDVIFDIRKHNMSEMEVMREHI